MRPRLRSWLSARRLLLLGVVVAVVLGGLAVVPSNQPTVEGVDNRFGAVNGTTTAIESDLQVRNPNPIGVALGGLTIDYAVDMNGIRMAAGVKTGADVGRGRSTVSMTTLLANERIPSWWVSHVRNGERTELAVNADVHSSFLGASFGAPEVTRTVETDIISAFNSTEPKPVGSSPTGGPILVVDETSAQWGEVDAGATRIDMRFVVRNPNPYPIPFAELGYRATMNGVEMGTGATADGGVIPPGEARIIEASMALNNGNIDEWWVSHLRNGQVTDLRIDFAARIELPTGTAEIPLDPLSYTRTIETDIFDNKPNETTGGTATPTPGSNGGGSSDDDTGTGTTTPTPRPTPMPTPADGGGLLSVEIHGRTVPTAPLR